MQQKLQAKPAGPSYFDESYCVHSCLCISSTYNDLRYILRLLHEQWYAQLLTFETRFVVVLTTVQNAQACSLLSYFPQH